MLYVTSYLTVIVWPPGEMASRLTTNQEIAGSTPAVVMWKYGDQTSHFAPDMNDTDFRKQQNRPHSFAAWFTILFCKVLFLVLRLSYVVPKPKV